MTAETEKAMKLRLAAHKGWAKTPNRSARTEAARKASHHTRFLTQARDMHPDASVEEIEQVAESLRKAHYTELALKSAQARQAKSAAAKRAKRQHIERQITAAPGADSPAA